jgi:hypothetical protein
MSKKRMKTKYKKWTEKDDEKLVSMYARGLKRADMARSMKRSVGATDQRLNRLRSLGLYQDEIGTLQKRSKHKKLGLYQDEIGTLQKRSKHKKVKRQFNPVTDFENVTTMFAKRHKEIEAKCGEQRLVIEDTIEKLEVLLGRLRKVLE